MGAECFTRGSLIRCKSSMTSPTSRMPHSCPALRVKQSRDKRWGKLVCSQARVHTTTYPSSRSSVCILCSGYDLLKVEELYYSLRMPFPNRYRCACIPEQVECSQECIDRDERRCCDAASGLSFVPHVPSEQCCPNEVSITSTFDISFTTVTARTIARLLDRRGICVNEFVHQQSMSVRTALSTRHSEQPPPRGTFLHRPFLAVPGIDGTPCGLCHGELCRDVEPYASGNRSAVAKSALTRYWFNAAVMSTCL